MGFDDGKRGAASSQNWRSNASSTSASWRRGSADSGYETASSRSTSPPASSSPLSSSSSRCTCQQYNQIYRSYKEQERVVRRWLCSETGSPRPESDLDNIDVGSLLRMAERLRGVTKASYSVAQALRKAIQGRKAAMEGWHWEETDHTCAACGRLWRRVDESHKHHIRELERMLVILGIAEVSVKPKVAPLTERSWR